MKSDNAPEIIEPNIPANSNIDKKYDALFKLIIQQLYKNFKNYPPS